MRRSENSPQLASSLMSLQSGLLSHRYSSRMQLPSPHLCSSAMQTRIMGLTAREERPRIKRMHVNAHNHMRQPARGDLQPPGRIGAQEDGEKPRRSTTGTLVWSFPPQIQGNLRRTDHHLTDITRLFREKPSSSRHCGGGYPPRR